MDPLLKVSFSDDVVCSRKKKQQTDCLFQTAVWCLLDGHGNTSTLWLMIKQEQAHRRHQTTHSHLQQKENKNKRNLY